MRFIYAVKWFFQDLVEDWSSKSPPDLLYFVPYVWKFKFQGPIVKNRSSRKIDSRRLFPRE